MQHDLILPGLALLVAGILGAAIAGRLRLSPILGFFVAGALIGEHALDLVPESEVLELLAEIGVAFLLFDVGVHLSLHTLWESRRDLLGLAPAQILLTSGLFGGAALALGFDARTAFVAGTGIALSSTAVVVQGLNERGAAASPLGRSAVSVLIGQDLFVVFLLILVPAVAAPGGGLGAALAVAAGKVALAIAAVTAIGRFLLRPLLDWVTSTRNDDVFTASALFVVLSIAWGTSRLGLSLPLGAFLAGMALAESRYSHLVRAELAPFRGLLLGLFFITVGMALDLHVFADEPVALAALVLALMAGKTAVVFAIARASGRSGGFSLRLAVTLAQGSEFGFLLFALAASQGLIAGPAAQQLAAAVTVSLALTPALTRLGERAAARLEPAPAEAAPTPVCQGRVAIIGFSEPAERLAEILAAAGVPYRGFGTREQVNRARARGFDVEYGDPSRPRALRMATVGEARAAAVLLEDPGVARQVIDGLRQVSPELPVYAAAPDAQTAAALEPLGLRQLLLRDDETPDRMGQALLRDLGFADATIGDCVEVSHSLATDDLGGALHPAAPEPGSRAATGG